MMIVSKENSIGEIFFLLATWVILLGLNALIYQQYPLVGSILSYTLMVYSVALALSIAFTAVAGILLLLHQIRDKD